MSETFDHIKTAAMSLPPKARAALAEELLESLDKAESAEIAEAWSREAESRVRAFREGKLADRLD